MDKSQRKPAVALSTLTSRVLAGSFAKQGFASVELVTRWPDIVGPEIAAHAEPIRMQWPRTSGEERQEPAVLVLRVEGPAAIEIQHLVGTILERVNRFFGWQAVDRISIRQAPLRRPKPRPARRLDPAEAARIAATLPIEDEGLKQALARLGAAIKAS
ncbi:MAG TPA: DciA family protein [Pseudorhodoplanes sp.]|nr:DciA family protein [Pseudorhodoplanes sp.]